jgi:tetratricopeptide (TPR) repeat protein
VALVGEPGVGKSRLVWEFSHSHRIAGWLVLASGSVSYGKATSYLPVIDLLKSYCGIEPRDDHRRVREKLTGKLLTLDPTLQPTLPAFFALLDVPLDDPAWTALDPPQRRQRTLDACKRLLLRESQEQPLLLVFEDLHWIDRETQALLDSLVESLPTARLLLLVNYRPEYEHDWHRKTYYRELRLDPLPAESAAELLEALLGEDAGLGALQRLLIERTEGNPFFLEESVRTLVETAALVGERGTYRLAQPLGTTQVPATVQAVLAARIDRLPPEDKRLLQAAAVIGKDVPYPLLQAIGDLSENALRQGLARLQAAEFLYETSLFPDLEYTFKHALTHEVAYGSLLQERRRVLHAQIVAVIEALYPDRLAEHVERLAHHSLRGEIWEKAASYLEQAGSKASTRSTPDEAIAYFRQALETLDHLPPTRAVKERGIDVRLAMQTPFLRHGRFGGYLLDDLRTAEDMAEQIDDQRRLGRVLASLGNYYWASGEHRRAREACERALAIALSVRDVELQVDANFGLGLVQHHRGDYSAAVAHWLEVGALLPDSQGRILAQLRERPQTSAAQLVFHGLTSWAVLTWRARAAWALAELGEFERGIALGQDALRGIEAFEHPWTQIMVTRCVGNTYMLRGEAERAIELLEAALVTAERWELDGPWSLVAADLGYAYAQVGRAGEGVSLLERAVAGSASVPAVACLADAYLLAGSRDAAWSTGERALALAHRHEERGNEAYVRMVLGAVAAQADPPDEGQAETQWRQALALAEELGMRPLAAHCHLGLGTLYHKLGRHDEAQVELTTAAEMYRGMKMPFWLAKAEAAEAGAEAS